MTAALAGGHLRRHVDLAGTRLGRLLVLGRVADSTWLVQCDCGRRTLVITGSLTTGRTRSCGDPSHRRHPQVQYRSAHLRLRALLGPARRRRCIDCGRQARQWSYDHRDPDEQTEDGHPYSLDPARYQARCIPCHVRFDLEYLATAVAPSLPPCAVVQGDLFPGDHLDQLGPPTGAHPPAADDPPPRAGEHTAP